VKCFNKCHKKGSGKGKKEGTGKKRGREKREDVVEK
jgi:hypothetical protein